METNDAFTGLSCRGCGEDIDPAAGAGRCPDCGGHLEPAYDHGSIDPASVDLLPGGEVSMWRYASLLPVPSQTAVTTAEGGTPAVSCPEVAAELGVGELIVKDEGRNPTGSIRDRELSVAVTLARENGAETVALPSTGSAGQSAAAYAARAGLSSEVFLPSRANFTAKAMVNVHGGEMSVVGGRYGDAADAFADATEDWHSVAPGGTPYRVEGAKTLCFELLGGPGTAPDAVVVPTAHGLTLAGLCRGARAFERLGIIEESPSLYAAQASGCAPVVEAFEAGDGDVGSVEHPDTICGALEVPDPAAGGWALEAIDATDGGAVRIDDDEILEAATGVAARAGLEPDVACGAAAAGAEELAGRGEIAEDDIVVVVNTATGNKEADVLRSHLMSKGV
ncbi:MAG: pyridoxal-phosphate dependent enzyme [Halobacteriales archaeon]